MSEQKAENSKGIVELVENKVKILTELKRLHMNSNQKLDKQDINKGLAPKPFNLWKGILLLPSKTLAKYFTDNYQKQIQRWFYLGVSLGSILEIPDDLTFVKASLQMLEEYDFHFSEASRPYQITLTKKITSTWGQDSLQTEMETMKERHNKKPTPKKTPILEKNTVNNTEISSTEKEQSPENGSVQDNPESQISTQELITVMKDRLITNFQKAGKEFLELIDDDDDSEDNEPTQEQLEKTEKKNKKKRAALLSPKIRHKNGVAIYEYLKTPNMPFNLDHSSVVTALLDILILFYRRFETTFYLENQAFFLEYLKNIDEIFGYNFLNFLQSSIQELSQLYLEKRMKKFQKNVFGYLMNTENSSTQSK